MDETPSRYPLLRRRRRRGGTTVLRRGGGRARRWRSWSARIVAAAMLATVLAGAWWWRHRPVQVDPRFALAHGLGQLSVGNYSAARRDAETALDVHPQWGLAHAVLARALLALGDGDAAEGELARAAAGGFDMRRAHQLLAEAYLLQGDPDRAAREAALAPSRYAAYALRVRARALAAGDDVPGGRSLLERRVAEVPDDRAAWRDLARIRFDAGDVGGASEAIRPALAGRPDPETLVLAGELVRARYGLVAALPWFDAALARDRYLPAALLAKAATLGDLGRYREMLALTRDALAARPGEPQALYLQAVMAARAGNRTLARTLLARTDGAVDDLPGALLLRGSLDYGDGRYEAAIASWSELVDQQPMNLVARRLLGAAMLRAGDAKGALAVLRPIALRADADGYTLGLVGRAFEATGERDWAARFLDRATRRPATGAIPFGNDDGVAAAAGIAADDPADPGAAVALIRALLDGGDAAGALARAQALVAVGRGAPAAHLLLGDTLAALGRWNEAADVYARAADLRFDAPTMLRLVEADGRAGRPAASRTLALYLAQNPASVPARRLLARAQLAAGEWQAATATQGWLRANGGGRDALLIAEAAAARLGDRDPAAALRLARASYRLQPLDPATVAVYARALAATGDAAGAAAMAKKLATWPRAGR